MHNYYIINGVVEFIPATGTLRDINNPEHVVLLNSPAGRCLLLLIERVGTIVTQDEFLDIVWEKRGMLVSSNTFYQNISILRKGLKNIGLPVNFVVTIPRIGLTLASDTHIKKLATKQQVEVSYKNANFIDMRALMHELMHELKTLQHLGNVHENANFIDVHALMHELMHELKTFQHLENVHENANFIDVRALMHELMHELKTFQHLENVHEEAELEDEVSESVQPAPILVDAPPELPPESPEPAAIEPKLVWLYSRRQWIIGGTSVLIAVALLAAIVI